MTVTGLTVLSRDRACTRCPLSAQEGLRNVCIPTHLLPYSERGHDQAVLFLSAAPSYHEDAEDRNFAGPAGWKLDTFYVHGSGVRELADLWAANSIRCRPPQDTQPTAAQITACAPYLAADIAWLSARYRRVAIVALGGPALRAVLGVNRSIADQAALQAQRIDADITPHSPLLQAAQSGNVWLFGTYNPAYLLSDPSTEQKVIPVMDALCEWLATGTITYEEMPAVETAPLCPPGFNGPVSMDTETHACLVGSPMRAFHPRKAMIVDGVRRDDLIVCSSIAWKDPSGALHVGYFDWRDPAHRARFLEWLRAASEIWGQNLSYDLKMIRAVMGESSIPAWRPVRDLLVETFLYDDLQERGLKVVSFIYRIATYAEDRKPVRSYHGPDDPALPAYACKDAWVAYRGIEIARRWQAEKFSAHPVARSKLSPDRDRWYSDQIWSAVLMEEHGCAISVRKLSELDRATRDTLASVTREAETLDLTVSGEGKLLTARALIHEAAACAVDASIAVYGEDAPETHRARSVVGKLELTDGGDISVGANNRNQLMGVLPLAHPSSARMARKLAVYSEAQSLGKILSSYTGVLLNGKLIDERYPFTRFTIVNAKSKHWSHEINPRTKKPYAAGRRIKKLPDKSRPVPVYDRRDALIRLTRRPDVGIAYPSIFILPKAADETGPGGGTKQFRWSFKAPALQTLPEKVFACLTSRFPGGRVLKYDLTSIEWRMAGYRSNDPVILREIADGVDMHERTAGELLSMDIAGDDLAAWIRTDAGRTTLCAAPDSATRTAARLAYDQGTESSERFLEIAYAWARNKVGKSPNFAWSYAGQVPVIVATCRVKGGIEIPEPVVRAWWEGMERRYRVYVAYRNAHIDAACAECAVHVPILGQSRSFAGTPDEIRSIYGEEITSPPIQTPSACLMQSAIVGVQRHFHDHRMKSVVCLNIHDALVVDAHPTEADGMPALVEWHLRNNWYLRALESHHDNRPFPLAFEGEWLDGGPLGNAQAP